MKVNITKFNDRNFWLAYVVIDGRRGQTRSTKAATKREAERLAAVWEDELRSGRYKPASSITWEEFKQRYCEEGAATLSDSTLNLTNVAFGHIDRLARPARLRDLTEDSLSRWIRNMLDERRPVTTVATYCRQIRATLNRAVDIKLIGQAPKMRIPKVPAGDKQMKGRPIVLEEHERMLVAVEKVVDMPYVPLWRRYLTGLWSSGLRLGEAVSLSWERPADVTIVMKPGCRPAIRFRPAG